MEISVLEFMSVLVSGDLGAPLHAAGCYTVSPYYAPDYISHPCLEFDQ